MKGSRLIIWSVVFSALLFLLNACMEEISYPPEPALTLEDFGIIKSSASENAWDSLGVLRMGFTDGDGDLGIIPDGDSVNLFMDLYQLEDNAFVNKEANFNAIIPNLPGADHQEYMKGTIEYFIPFHAMVSEIIDTIHFEIHVVDGSGNKSNVIKTPTFVLKQRGNSAH